MVHFLLCNRLCTTTASGRDRLDAERWQWTLFILHFSIRIHPWCPYRSCENPYAGRQWYIYWRTCATNVWVLCIVSAISLDTFDEARRLTQVESFKCDDQVLPPQWRRRRLLSRWQGCWGQMVLQGISHSAAIDVHWFVPQFFICSKKYS